MERKDFTKDFSEIQDMCSKIRTLNESISFADGYDDEEDYNDEQMPAQEMPQQEEQMPNAEQQDPEDAEVEAELQDENSPINMIREIALKGMVRLCKTPEDPQYEVLKKVFTMIDKANDKKNEGQPQ